MMTIKELKEKLNEFDDDKIVLIESSYGEYSPDEINFVEEYQKPKNEWGTRVPSNFLINGNPIILSS